MASGIRSFKTGLHVEVVNTLTSDRAGELQLFIDNKIHLHNGTDRSPLVTESHVATLTGKTLSGLNNTFSDIAYSSLVLTNSIVDADINAAASIAYSKLNLSNSIVDADVSTSASIAYSKLASLTASRVLESDGSGVISASLITSTELSYLSGVTSSLQTQLDDKANKDLSNLDPIVVDLLFNADNTYALADSTNRLSNIFAYKADFNKVKIDENPDTFWWGSPTFGLIAQNSMSEPSLFVGSASEVSDVATKPLLIQSGNIDFATSSTSTGDIYLTTGALLGASTTGGQTGVLDLSTGPVSGGNASSGGIGIYTGQKLGAGGSSGSLSFQTGGSTTDSGAITIATGIASGVRGQVSIDGRYISLTEYFKFQTNNSNAIHTLSDGLEISNLIPTGIFNIGTADTLSSQTRSVGITTGSMTGGGSAQTGDIYLITGLKTHASSSGQTGVLQMQTGEAAGSAFSGNAYLFTGNSSGTGQTGDVWIYSGDSVGNQSGEIKLFTGTGTVRGKISLDGLNVDVNSTQIKNLAEPTAATDAATKQYVDNISAGLDPKQSVRVATTVALPGAIYATTPSNGRFTSAPSTIDTVSLNIGDRVLVKDQVDAKQNGIYVYDAANQLTRASDSDGSPASEVSGGNYTFIEQGAVNISRGYVLQADGIVTLNVDNINWVQFNGAAGGANTALSNLIATSINQHLLPDTTSTKDLGSGALKWRYLYAGNIGDSSNPITSSYFREIALQDFTLNIRGFVSSGNPTSATSTSTHIGLQNNAAPNGNVGIWTGNTTSSGSILIETGNGSAGESGDVSLQTGTATTTRGKINLNARSINIGAQSASNPTGTAAFGDFYYNTNAHALKYYGVSHGGATIDWHWQTGLKTATRTVSADTLIDNSWGVILVDATAATRTITLPSAFTAGFGKQFVIKKIDASVNSVIIDPFISETIDGQATQTLTSQYESITIVCDGVTWWII